MRLARTVAVALCASALALGLRMAASLGWLLVRELRAGVPPFATPGWAPLWQEDAWVPFLVGGLVPALAIATLAAKGRARHRAVRWLGALAAIGCAACGLFAAIADRRPVEASAFLVAAAAGAWLASGRLPSAGRGAIALAALVQVALAAHLFTVAWEDRARHPARLALELRAAWPERAGAVVLGRDPEELTVGGARWTTDRADALVLDASRVGAVRCEPGRLVVHLTDGSAAAALARRSWRRISQHDALLVDGRAIAAPRYDTMLYTSWFSIDGAAIDADLCAELVGPSGGGSPHVGSRR